jgi:hypothetical protein
MEVVLGEELCYDDGTPESWWVVGDTWDDNSFAIRLTPNTYPARVILARAFVSDETPFSFTINGISGANPGDVLEGGEAINGVMEAHGWAISEWSDGPVIQSGSFFLLIHWTPQTPNEPAVGTDNDNVTFRSYWHNNEFGWQMVSDGEYMMRAVVASAVGIEEIGTDGSRPASYELLGNYPNPFNPNTDIKFLAPEAGNVRIEIYNVAGQLVNTVFDEYVEAGVKTVSWDGTNADGSRVNSGIYFSKMIAGNKIDTQKMVLLK